MIAGVSSVEFYEISTAGFVEGELSTYLSNSPLSQRWTHVQRKLNRRHCPRERFSEGFTRRRAGKLQRHVALLSP